MKTSLSKQVRRSFRYYFEGWDIADTPDDPQSIIKFGITKFTVIPRKTTILINITLERPGLLIGKAGTRINKLQAHLSDLCKKPVQIHLIESQLWYWQTHK